MDTIDLDINNYDLEDLLNLFHITDNNLTEETMNKSKKITLKTHPDKSGLDKSYFLFFSQAYKLLHEVYLFQNKPESISIDKSKSMSNISYIQEDMKTYNKILIDNLIKKFNNNKEFNKWFNEEFEKVKINDEEETDGYDEWFRDNKHCENDNNQNNNINNNENSIITERMNFNSRLSSSNILGSRQDNYSSGIFSGLQYEDLRHAHTIDTDITISAENYKEKDITGGVEKLKRERNIKIQPQSNEEADRQLNKQQNHDDHENISRAYKLSRQQEEIAQKNNNWWSALRLLH